MPRGGGRHAEVAPICRSCIRTASKLAAGRQAHSAAGGPARACAGGADLQVTITGLDPEASAAAIDARLGRT
jgi:hypothetical protein